MIFVDEILQLELSRTEALSELNPLAQEGHINFVDQEHFRILDKGVQALLSHWDKSVYESGLVGGGNINGNPAIKRFTAVVEFDTSAKLLEKGRIINYLGRSIIFDCLDGYYYCAKIYAKNKDDIDDATGVINGYLSHLSYYFKLPVHINATHSGSIDLTTKTKRQLPRTGIFRMLPKLPDLDERQSHALAFYRQYRNFFEFPTTESLYYQAISLAKIIEGANPSLNLSVNRQNFLQTLNDAISKLDTENLAKVQEIEAKYQSISGDNKKFGEILWEHYRHGIAHWRADKKKFLDPDVPDSIIALVIRVLAAAVLICLKDVYRIPSN